MYKKKKASKVNDTESPVNEEDIVDDDLLDDPSFESLRGDSRILGFVGSDSRAFDRVRVLVLQPWVKWGPKKRTDTSGQLLLDEAAALVATLPGVEVVAKVSPLAGLDLFLYEIVSYKMSRKIPYFFVERHSIPHLVN